MESKRTAEIIHLLPEDVVIDEIVNVRPFSAKHTSPEAHEQHINNLVDGFEREGQLQAIQLRKVKHGRGKKAEMRYHLVCGKNRVEAAFQINTAKMEDDTMFLVRGEVQEDLSEASAWLQAYYENQDRENPSPMDQACNIRVVRQQFGLKGKKNTKKVAELMHVSEATITQREKLLSLGEDLQAKVHDGALTPASAYALLDVEEGKRQEVLEAAEEDQRGRENGEPESGEAGNAKGTKARKQKAVKANAITRAARRREALGKPKPRTRSESRGWFEVLTGPAYGKVAAEFASKYIQWLDGEIGDEVLEKAWEKLAGSKKEKVVKVKAAKKKVAKKVATKTVKKSKAKK